MPEEKKEPSAGELFAKALLVEETDAFLRNMPIAWQEGFVKVMTEGGAFHSTFKFLNGQPALHVFFLPPSAAEKTWAFVKSLKGESL